MCDIGVLHALLVRLFNSTYVEGSKVRTFSVIRGWHSVADDHCRLMEYDAMFVGCLRRLGGP